MKMFIIKWRIIAIAIILTSTFSSFSCDHDKDDGYGGNIIGTWKYDFNYLDYYYTYNTYFQFRKDGTFVEVEVTTYTDELMNIWDDDFSKQEIEIGMGTYKVSGNKLYVYFEDSKYYYFDSEDNFVCNYKVKGNKMTLTELSGNMLSYSLIRVSDTIINQYLKRYNL